MKLEEKQLPKGWEVKKFEDLLDYIQPTKHIVSSTEYSDEYETPVLTAGKSFIIGYTNEKNGIFDQLPVIIFDDFTTAHKFVRFPFKVKSSAMKILKPRSSSMNIKFIFYYMQTVRITFDTHKRYWISVYSKISIPTPPPLEQQAIVAKIEELFSQLENSKQQLLEAQAKLKTYRQSLLKSAFKGRLTNENLKDGELPRDWTKVPIKDVADTLGGYAFKSGDFLNNGNYQVLRMGNVRSGLIRYEESPVFLNDVEDSVLKRSLLQKNDVVITQTGTRKKRDYGYTALIQKPNLLLNQRIASIRFRENFLPKFFLYFSWTDTFRDQFFANETGNVGQGNVGMKAVTEAKIPYCSLEEQVRIVSEIESKLTICDKIEEAIIASLKQAETLRQSILKKAFEGQLVAPKIQESLESITKIKN